MVSTTGARVLVAGSLVAIGVVLTLHFLFRKSKKKNYEKDKEDTDETVPKSTSNDNMCNKPGPNNTTSEDNLNENNILGKRKHPNDDFLNSDIDSPKKPHEMLDKTEQSRFVPEEKPEMFEFFRKELDEFLKDGERKMCGNTNQNAAVNGTSSENHVTKETDKRKEDGMNHNMRNGEQINGHNSEEVICAEVSTNLSAAATKSSVTAKLSENGTLSQNCESEEFGRKVTNNYSKDEQNVTKEVSRLVDDQSYTKFSEDEIKDAILVSQTSPGLLSGPNADVLVALLTHPDAKLQDAALNGINRCSTFTRNQNLFREHGCLSRLSDLLYQQKMSKAANPKVVTSVANAITNLSSNEENHRKLEECVSTLVDLTLEDETGESVCLSSLQALTNLSITSQHHGHYTRVVQRLYDLVDTGAPSIRLQAAKVLVNLSLNPELVPHMLAAKAPACSVDLLKQTTNEELLLRWTTLLANILTTAKDQKLTSSSLPADDKAPSPETMYTALYGVNSTGQLKSKVYLLSRHKNENISHQATRVYQVISTM